MSAAKPDCTGQRFGRLIVVGREDVPRENVLTKGGYYRSRFVRVRRWILECDCGATIKLLRADFDSSGKQKSCGCLRREGYDNGRRPIDITGRRFGELVAVKLISTVKNKHNKTTWKMQCDCGKTCHKTVHQLGAGWSLNCGDRVRHLWGAWYPPAPTPYPEEAGAIAAKYLYLVTPQAKTHWKRKDQAVEDYRMDRLLRVAWIVVYRRSIGEEFSEEKERRYISKSLRYAKYTVYNQRNRYGLSYNRSQLKAVIGSEMTDLTSSFEAVAQAGTQPGNLLSRPKKRVEFRRC